MTTPQPHPLLLHAARQAVVDAAAAALRKACAYAVHGDDAAMSDEQAEQLHTTALTVQRSPFALTLLLPPTSDARSSDESNLNASLSAGTFWLGRFINCNVCCL